MKTTPNIFRDYPIIVSSHFTQQSGYTRLANEKQLNCSEFELNPAIIFRIFAFKKDCIIKAHIKLSSFTFQWHWRDSGHFDVF